MVSQVNLSGSAQLLEDLLGENLRRLGGRQKEFICLHYGIGDGHCYSLKDLQSVFGLTPSEVVELKARSLARLREIVASKD